MIKPKPKHVVIRDNLKKINPSNTANRIIYFVVVVTALAFMAYGIRTLLDNLNQQVANLLTFVIVLMILQIVSRK